MQCSICKEKPATVHLTQIVGDKMQKLDLCEDCAKTNGLGAAQEVEQAVGTDLKCPRCGFSQADFKKSGRLGCPECYKTFAEGLGGLLKTMHKGTRHTGKAPEALRVSRENSDRLKTLQKKLNKAIESENFEEAAQLRDELKKINERPATQTNLTR
jgi:protein arginine kinase activator